MKMLLTFALFLASAAACSSQTFEGEIIYSNTYVSKLPGLSNDKLKLLLGDTQEYYIKGTSYRSVTNAALIGLQVYEARTNRVYNQRPGNDTLYWIDAAASPDVVVSWNISRHADTVLGIPCDLLLIKTNNGSQAVYYNARYPVDSIGFRRHRFGNWDLVTSKCGALPLKTVIENGQFRMESVATETRPMPLADSLFTIGTTRPIKKGM